MDRTLEILLFGAGTGAGCFIFNCLSYISVVGECLMDSIRSKEEIEERYLERKNNGFLGVMGYYFTKPGREMAYKDLGLE